MALDAAGGGGGSASPAGAARTQEPLLADAWIVQKLKNDWSSSDFGGLLTRERLSDAVASFRLLDTAVKVRFLLSFLSMRREVVEESKFAIVEIIDAAENDAEEWVRVGAGIVKQYMFMSEDGAESGDTFFHEQIASTTAKVLEAVDAPPARAADDFFCHEDAFLNASVRAETPAPAAKHFTVVEAAAATANGKGVHAADEKSAERKAGLHRSQMPRPGVHVPSSSSSVPTRLTPTTTKPPPPPPPPARKNMTELSEIRRKADAGRFKRHRSRISMIDIDEVKQIELDKVQKAEERKKQKLANAAKEKAAAAAAAAATAGGAATAENPGANGAGEGETYGDDGQVASQSAPRPVAEEYSQPDDDEEQDEHHDEEEDDDEEDEEEEDARGGSSAATHHLHHHDDDRSEYVADGTQALLNAAIMTEAVGHQPHAMHSQHQFLHHYEPEQQQQQQQQHYHQGFEPEDASQHIPYGYGFASTYSSHFGDHSYQQQPQQQPPPFQLPHMQSQFSSGFLDEQTSQHVGQPRLPGFDQTHTNGNHGGGYGAPEYWR